MKQRFGLGFFFIVCLGLISVSAQAAERIYLLAGQSNMMGKGRTHELPAAYKTTPANVTFYYQGRPRALAKFASFGPEVVFAHEVARAFPHDQHIIIKLAATGSSITQWQPGKGLYKSLLRQMNFSLPEDHAPVTAILWMQGESDARNAAQANQYAPLLSRFIQALRQDTDSPNSLFILGKVNPEVPNAFPMLAKVQASQRLIQQNTPRTLMITTDGLSKLQDQLHYDAQGQMELGRRFAQAYISHAR
ncbi:sialate O-acetylesterase [Thiolinea disciformis]|uniref:sialate O-acetylesterase n=1 Tax=Thiolinea disciformis TaxID=125614 RepID=UPI000364FD7E|nr:sialate O-acetylesterase [Thiolinea disciformis]